MVLLKPETSSDGLNSSSVICHGGVMKQRNARWVIKFPRTQRIPCILCLKYSRMWCRNIYHPYSHRVQEYGIKYCIMRRCL
ncbi:LOW QUALITY PROTEIN: Hypothetical protein PHPALM_37141 [Phytophthora palmivora]|uniref:Uncharacterized protein n=1 Tax=Phytophthora palmivora TaxID=4796 RepID=A0A2P4WY61_9STRA|nr:LOW QUALITY PROTEIN: Hypothetical protein PHPALM_37141 [Phytophthora palmivora]